MRQLDLFAAPARGTSGGTEAALRQALSDALKCATYSRDQVAERMSVDLGVQVTKAQLDSWTADSKAHTHRIPASYLPAFCRATNSNHPIELLAQELGLWVADQRHRLLAVRGQLAEQKRQLQQRERALQALLGGSTPQGEE